MSERYKDERGETRYADPEEQALADELYRLRYSRLSTLDLILESGRNVWRTLDQQLLRDELLELRAKAIAEFRAGNREVGVLCAYVCWKDLSSEWSREALEELQEEISKFRRKCLDQKLAAQTYRRVGTVAGAARELGCSPKTLRKALKKEDDIQTKPGRPRKR